MMTADTAPVAESEYPYWLGLARAPGVGPVAFAKLLTYFSSPRAVFSAGEAAWENSGLRNKTRDYLRRPDWRLVEADMAWLAKPGHTLLTLADTRYPPHLRQIHDAPPLLFIVGDPAVLALPQLAIVGSRNPSRNGEETAYEFAHHLGGMGLVIASGLAIGIDVASHRGALDGGGQTVAVMATGLDIVYPSQHAELARQIAERGALVSESPPGTAALPQLFPRRNRIISGLALGTLVVEATLRSGSLITARQAAEQGREVFAIPGSIHNPLAKGCHALIKEGAKLVEAADDILQELRLAAVLAPAHGDAQSAPITVGSVPALDHEYAHLLQHMAVGAPTTIDSLVENSGLSADNIASMLLILELQGWITSAAGGRYVRLGHDQARST